MKNKPLSTKRKTKLKHCGLSSIPETMKLSICGNQLILQVLPMLRIPSTTNCSVLWGINMLWIFRLQPCRSELWRIRFMIKKGPTTRCRSKSILLKTNWPSCDLIILDRELFLRSSQDHLVEQVTVVFHWGRADQALLHSLDLYLIMPWAPKHFTRGRWALACSKLGLTVKSNPCHLNLPLELFLQSILIPILILPLPIFIVHNFWMKLMMCFGVIRAMGILSFYNILWAYIFHICYSTIISIYDRLGEDPQDIIHSFNPYKESSQTSDVWFSVCEA